MYDGMILAPFDHQKKTFAEVIRERVASFLTGNWGPLINEMRFRDPEHIPSTTPLATEPEDTLAMRCQRIFTRTHDIGAAAAAL
jgi:hypothetical protein